MARLKRKSLWTLFTGFTLALGVVCMFATYSRSAWGAGAVAFMLYILKTKGLMRLYRPTTLLSTIFITIVGLAVVGPHLFARLQTLSYVFESGTGKGRIMLMQQAGMMIQEFPIFGVGLNNFTAVMAQRDLPDEDRGFLYPVHNTFLLFFAETGILGGVVFILFILNVLLKSWKLLKNNIITIGIWCGAFTFLVNGQFHTLFSQDPTLDVFILMLAYLSTHEDIRYHPKLSKATIAR